MEKKREEARLGLYNIRMPGTKTVFCFINVQLMQVTNSI